MVRLNRIYTRTGDDGTTGLADGSRISKSDIRMEAVGAVDEANCSIGSALVVLKDAMLTDALRAIQNDLFDLGADLATPGSDFAPDEMTLRIVQSQIDRLEAQIDAINAEIEPLKSFILPGGTPAAAALHVARAAARRAERVAVGATRETPLNPLALIYINRLSDYLFVAARYVNKRAGGDVLWIPGGSR
ncbi:cob(I)yrinic acid a,c-diamide adenosyltransferase [Stakelama sp. CBK3Z-3]|uniref:Corrinoid adenosyltransferase n=1 Tax=Stakelama flava TaxID=2860338 RepID=A0ABS6XNR9_9SPHN|nr:cob(I)yrinic acid a,c-diamide adenosyltransferase [Stakelama flava]MBW4331051.1 cob(I)yrinic acid a,c-diamide adenosyltransferase [Stakelama flava]